MSIFITFHVLADVFYLHVASTLLVFIVQYITVSMHYIDFDNFHILLFFYEFALHFPASFSSPDTNIVSVHREGAAPTSLFIGVCIQAHSMHTLCVHTKTRGGNQEHVIKCYVNLLPRVQNKYWRKCFQEQVLLRKNCALKGMVCMYFCS